MVYWYRKVIVWQLCASIYTCVLEHVLVCGGEPIKISYTIYRIVFYCYFMYC